jgi:hypothetical protein
MAIQKQNLDLPFAQGVDTKTDPFRVTFGKFLALENSVFGKAGSLLKRNGYESLPRLNDLYKSLTTFNGNLTAIGNKISALSQGSSSWVEKGSIKPVGLETLPAIRNNFNQSECDLAVSNTNLACVVYKEDASTSTPLAYKYAIIDSVTGQNLVAPTEITTTQHPKVYFFSNYFVILYKGAGNTLYYIRISITDFSVTTPIIISAVYTAGVDAVVNNNRLYISWYFAGSSSIYALYIDQFFNISIPVLKTNANYGQNINMCAAGSDVWILFYSGVSTFGYAWKIDLNLLDVIAPMQIINLAFVTSLTASSVNGVLTFFYSVLNDYAYSIGTRSDFINKNTIDAGGTLGTASVFKRSVALASDSFIYDDEIYVLCTYGGTEQPTYFLIDSEGNIVLKLAYSNGGGYSSNILPSVTVIEDTAYFPYLYKDLIQSKSSGQRATVQINSQTGVNMAAVTFGVNPISAEIANDLHFTGGFLWMYDGYLPVEHGFFLYPENLKATWSAVGGDIVAQPVPSSPTPNTDVYYYQAIYEWMDNQGNIFRSSPNIPLAVSTTGVGNT